MAHLVSSEAPDCMARRLTHQLVRSPLLTSSTPGDLAMKWTEPHASQRTPMLRRRGNPNWSKGAATLSPPSCLATKFENEMRRLGLTKETCAASHELRRWCERNKDCVYIPESRTVITDVGIDRLFSDESRECCGGLTCAQSSPPR